MIQKKSDPTGTTTLGRRAQDKSSESVTKATAAMQNTLTTEIKKQTVAMEKLADKVDKLGEAKGDMGPCPVRDSLCSAAPSVPRTMSACACTPVKDDRFHFGFVCTRTYRTCVATGQSKAARGNVNTTEHCSHAHA